MAGKITDLTAIPAIDPANDVIEIVDVSANASYKVTPQGLFTLTSNGVSLNDIQTLTNKTLTAPTINSPILGGTITGTYTLAGTPTFPSSVVTLAGSQTLTNKILTSPTINAPTITNASMTADAITGFSSANTGTIYGIPVTNSTLGSTVLAANAVQANQLATNAITLGYAQSTSLYTGAGDTSAHLVTGLTITVTIPAGGRRVKITGFVQDVATNTATATVLLTLWDGTVGSGTQLAASRKTTTSATGLNPIMVMAVVTPSAGSKTYNVGLQTDNGSNTPFIEASSTAPAFILAEAI